MKKEWCVEYKMEEILKGWTNLDGTPATCNLTYYDWFTCEKDTFDKINSLLKMEKCKQIILTEKTIIKRG